MATLPDLVDGRDIFLREGEVLSKASFIYDENLQWYISNLSPVKYRGQQEYLLCFKMGSDPGVRITQYVNRDQLVFDK